MKYEAQKNFLLKAKEMKRVRNYLSKLKWKFKVREVSKDVSFPKVQLTEVNQPLNQ